MPYLITDLIVCSSDSKVYASFPSVFSILAA